MTKTRLEAFSDGVLAIIITIMVLEMKVPKGAGLYALAPLAPVFASYVMSFLYVGIYWNNHHHLFQLVKRVDGLVLLANLHLLFWLSLIPFVTGWMGSNDFSAFPTAMYGGVLLLSSLAWHFLQSAVIAIDGEDSAVKLAVGKDLKGKISSALYCAAIMLAFVSNWIAVAIYVSVAVIWLIPDRRFERQASGHANSEQGK